MTDSSYVVCGTKPWNRHVFDEQLRTLPGKWYFIGSHEEFTLGRLEDLDPRYMFFLHWSRKVPDELLERFECVNFHMTDVPYGRGGTPLQNLIEQGHSHTRLSALRMVSELDAGPVYLKEDLCLRGTAEEVYLRASELSARMIQRIIQENPEPEPQDGKPTVFRRRQPDQSEVPHVPSLEALHDFIRMLDAEGYPRAFLMHAGFRFEFHRAARYFDRVEADVVIKRASEDS